MKYNTKELTTELAAVWACLQALRGCNGNKGKGLFLYNSFEKSPQLIKYFRAAYDEHKVITKLNEETIGGLPSELYILAVRINDKDLGAGLPLGLLNKVLVKLGREPIAKWREEPGPVIEKGLRLELGTIVQGVATAVLTYNGRRCANLSIPLKECEKAGFFTKLKELGFEVCNGPGVPKQTATR